MQEENKNMELWDQVKTTKDKYIKKLPHNPALSSINAHSQIRKATELWGSYGKTWGVKNQSFTINEKDFALYQATFFYPDGEFVMNSDIETFFKAGKRAGKYNDDWSKKVATDALTKALSKLGFSADVFLNEHYDSKYTKQESNESQPFNNYSKPTTQNNAPVNNGDMIETTIKSLQSSSLPESEKVQLEQQLNGKVDTAKKAFCTYIMTRLEGAK